MQASILHDMKFIKQIITDAKKQKDTMTQRNAKTKTVSTTAANIPTIKIIECQQQFFDEKLFEYEMIQRAREAEALLTEILTNCENSSKLQTTMESLMAKFKSKSTKNPCIPKIEVFEAVSNDEEEMMEAFIQRAQDAKTLLEQLLNNCECMSEDSSGDSGSDDDQSDGLKRQNRHRGSPSKRIAFKGQGLTTLEIKKKRKLVPDISTSLNLKKLNQTNFYGTIGLEGKFTAMEV